MKRSGRIYSTALLFVALGCATGCRHAVVPLREPNSVESLCLGAATVRPKAFKLPGIEGLRNDRLVKGQDLHVDLDAVQRVVASTVRELSETAIDEDDVREFVTMNGGGVIVWWRHDPVALHFAAHDAKSRASVAQIFAAALPDAPPWKGGRELILLERTPDSPQPPHWRAFAAYDREHVCM